MTVQISSFEKTRLFELVNDTLDCFNVSMDDLEDAADNDSLPDWIKDMAENFISLGVED